jgi:energy-coupling factor transporter ATP-binding protein EcfA2
MYKNLALSYQSVQFSHTIIDSMGRPNPITIKKNNHNKSFEIPSLSLCHGQFIIINGKSGSGKSTFLRILSGNLKVQSGLVSIPSDVYLHYNVIGSIFRSMTVKSVLLLLYQRGIIKFYIECLETFIKSSSKEEVCKKIYELNQNLRGLLSYCIFIYSVQPYVFIDGQISTKGFENNEHLNELIEERLRSADIVISTNKLAVCPSNKIEVHLSIKNRVLNNE